ncbi:Long-chain primary alcohol dehydrogenase AdhA [compost metagenome]
MTISLIGTRSEVIFGEGARHELAPLVAKHASPRVLLIASASALQRADIKALHDALVSVADVKIWDRVTPNPRCSDIDACRQAFAGTAFSHIVGIGGGSAMDQAKATAMALHCQADMADLLTRKSPLPSRANTLILLPTTSGTGAELSYGAILTNDATGEKLGLRGANNAADHALVDPELTYGLPEKDSMTTGFDALTHAIETWLSSTASPYTKDLSRGAIERVFRWLPVVRRDPGDPEARRQMAYTSMMMGVNLALSTTCMPHRLQYPIGAATDTAHAAGLAAIYPAWLDHVLPFASSRLAECADWIGIAVGQDEAERAAAFVAAVKALQRQIDLTPSLADLGVTEDMITHFPPEVSGRLDTDPGYRSPDDIAAIYQKAFYARA